MKTPRGWLIPISLALLFMASLMVSPVYAGEIRVITSEKTATDALDDSAVKGVFLGKKSTWPDGTQVEFVILKSGDTHKDFLKGYVKKSTSQFKTYWKKQVFTGKGKNPKSFDSESDLVVYVSGKPGVIGYVSASTDIAGAKVLNEK